MTTVLQQVESGITGLLTSAYAHLKAEVKAITASQIGADISKVLSVLTSNSFTVEAGGETITFNYDVNSGNVVVTATGTGNTISISINPTAMGAGTTYSTVLAQLEADLIKLIGEASPIVAVILANYSTIAGILTTISAV
jgi:hypothetical protein